MWVPALASQEAYGLDDEISQHGGCGCGPCHEEESLPADLWMPEEGVHVCLQVDGTFLVESDETMILKYS